MHPPLSIKIIMRKTICKNPNQESGQVGITSISKSEKKPLTKRKYPADAIMAALSVQ